jgi:hypothetical protein
VAEETFPIKYLLGKFGTSESSVGICDSADFPIGIVTDEASASNPSEPEIVNVALLGGPDTLRAVASGTISVGSILVPAENGRVKSLPGRTSDDVTYESIGIALTSATAGDQIIEFLSCVPQQRVVKGIE